MKAERYAGIDLLAFLFSIAVILVHCGRLVENPILHFFLKSGIGRLGVPFFMITGAYFYHQKSRENNNYPQKYYRRMVKLYLLWSIIYFPLFLNFLIQNDFSMIYLPIALLLALMYTGVWYHLWYIPNFLMPLFVIDRLYKKVAGRIAVLFGVSLIFYLIGSVETYSGYMKGSEVHQFFMQYKSVFLTTRNFLFYSPIYILIGFILADYFSNRFRHAKILFCGATVLWLAELWLIYQRQGSDKNFIVSTILLIPLLFLLARDSRIDFYHSHLLSEMSAYIFFAHPFIIEVIRWVGNAYLNIDITGLSLFFWTNIVTIMFVAIYMVIKRNTKPLH